MSDQSHPSSLHQASLPFGPQKRRPALSLSCCQPPPQLHLRQEERNLPAVYLVGQCGRKDGGERVEAEEEAQEQGRGKGGEDGGQ